jgi:hypothetical protein
MSLPEETPTLAIVFRNALVNSGSRSWIRYCLPFRIPSMLSVRLRPL